MSLVYVNDIKKRRAEEIYGYITGDKTAVDSTEVERATRFGKYLNDQKIDVKKKDEALKAIYLRMGGLMRTETEQKAVEANKRKIATRKGRKMIS